MGSKRRPRSVVEVDLSKLDGLLDSSQVRPLEEDEANEVKKALHALVAQLKPEFRNSEKLKSLFPSKTKDSESEESGEEKKRPPGHGRNGAAVFDGAEKISVKHPEIAVGCTCPECSEGKVYPLKEPKTIIRMVGQMPISSTVYELDRLRCNRCGEVFTAPEPSDVGPDKYDESVSSTLALMHYGAGMPFNRMETLQKQAGVPLPVSTQWDIVEEAATLLKPILEEMIRQAAQASVIQNDDTSVQIIQMKRPEGDERTGVFTTGVVATLEGQQKIAIFKSGRQHAGENLRDILRHRANNLAPVIQVSDALSRNHPKVLNPGVQLLSGYCLTHGRRKFVDLIDGFPEECRYLIEMLGKVYLTDEQARMQNLGPKERLKLHQRDSEPVMKELKKWINAELEGAKVEPNSPLGKAMKYMQTHWAKLTLFLRQPGVPLDNNIVERSLKKAILYRKNSLFYRTANGADAGDLYMSLIHTCELNRVAAFDYLLQTQRYARDVNAQPANWMPWNYKDALAKVQESPS